MGNRDLSMNQGQFGIYTANRSSFRLHSIASHIVHTQQYFPICNREAGVVEVGPRHLEFIRRTTVILPGVDGVLSNS